MLLRLIILLIIAGAALLLVNWVRSAPPERIAGLLRKTALYGVIALVMGLTVTGRLPWLLALIGASVPLLMRLLSLVSALPQLQRLARALGVATSSATDEQETNGVSSIRTRFLTMSLDHRTGTLAGTVLEGPYRGRQLDKLSLTQLLDLLQLARATDSQSAALLETYLDRTFGDRWRQADADPGPKKNAGSRTDSMMTRDEALAILALPQDASDQDVRAAHRRLIQKLHPDRGGSDYLAAKINQAKDLLLNP